MQNKQLGITFLFFSLKQSWYIFWSAKQYHSHSWRLEWITQMQWESIRMLSSPDTQPQFNIIEWPVTAIPQPLQPCWTGWRTSVRKSIQPWWKAVWLTISPSLLNCLNWALIIFEHNTNEFFIIERVQFCAKVVWRNTRSVNSTFIDEWKEWACLKILSVVFVWFIKWCLLPRFF